MNAPDALWAWMGEQPDGRPYIIAAVGLSTGRGEKFDAIPLVSSHEELATGPMAHFAGAHVSATGEAAQLVKFEFSHVVTQITKGAGHGG